MNVSAFQRSLSNPKPPARLPPALAALWWAARDHWEQAHTIVMNDDGKDCAWVHAHLHRREGDLDNARYWYRQAGRRPASGPFEAEWTAIATALLQAKAS